MAVTTDPNAVFYSYRGVGTNQAVKKFIDLLDEKGIPHRGSESEPIEGALTDFEEKIGAANIIVIFYSQEYFESEHCMNEYANIRKYENEARKAATYYVKCGDYDINGLVNFWGGQKATLENPTFALTPINQRSLANGCYFDKTTLYCVQNLDNYFCNTVRYKEDSLQTLVDLICDKYHELSSKNISINQGNTLSAPSFKIPKPQTNLIERNDKVERLHDLVSKNDFTNLYGFGGSGKTSLTHLFVDKYRSDFNQIAYVVVNNNVKADFVSQINDTIHLFKPEEDKATQDKDFRNIKDIIKDTDNREKVDRYKSIIDYLEVQYKSDKPNLCIIDINNADDAEKFGEDLVNNTLPSNKTYPDGWKYLIVSRGNIYKGLAQLNLNEKEQDIVHTDFLKKLFLKYVGDKYNDFSDGDFAELFETIYYSPLMAEQLGIYLKDMPKKSVSQIKEILHKNNFKNEKRSGITSQNRSSEEEKTIIGFLKNIIVFDKLNVGEQILLKHFVLWPTEYIPKEVIWQLLSKTFESEKNRVTKLWSIVKRYFTSFGEQQRIGVFFNRTKRYAVSKLWFYILLVLSSLSFLTSLLSEHNLIVSYSFGGIWGMLMYLLLEIVSNGCTFRTPFRNCARIAFGATIGLLVGLISSYTSLPKLFFIFAFWGAPFMISFFPFLKKIIKCLSSKSYINIDQDYFDSLLSDLSKRGIVSEKEENNNISYKMHGLMAESLRTQIDIPNSDYSDYLDSIKRIEKYNDKDFEPFATCIEHSLSIHKIVVDDDTSFNIAYEIDNNASTANYAAILYQGIIDHRKINLLYSDKNFVAKAHNNLAILQKNHLKDYASAEDNYKKAIELGKKLPKRYPEYQDNLARWYRNLADLQENHLKDYTSAEENYKKAIEISESLPKDNPEYQNNLASRYFRLAYLQQNKLKDYPSAEYNYKKTIETWNNPPKENTYYQNTLACAYNNLANLQKYQIKDYTAAEEKYKKAIEISENLPKDNPFYQDYLAIWYKNLADLQANQLKNYVFAEDNYKKAIEISENLPKDNPEYQNGLASTFNDLAVLQLIHLKDYESAKTNYEKAIAIGEQLPKDNHLYQSNLAIWNSNLALLQKNHLGDFDSAKANLEKAIAIREQLPKDNPEYQNYLANTYNILANLQRFHCKDYELSKSNYEKAIAIGEQLPKDNPKCQNDLVMIYDNLTFLLQCDMEDYKSAKYYNDKAIEISESLPNDSPNFQNVLAFTYNNRGLVLYKVQKKYAEAVEIINKAIDITKQLSDIDDNYLIYWITYKHSLAEIFFENNEMAKAKDILVAIQPMAKKCITEKPNDGWTQWINSAISALLSKKE